LPQGYELCCWDEEPSERTTSISTSSERARLPEQRGLKW
jgi:hypothetical protein